MADGAPAENLTGCDLHQGFMDLGYDLFRDRDTLATKFVEGDIVASQFDGDQEHPFKELLGKIDIIHVSSFFHLFPLPTQLLIAKRLLRLLQPVPGSLIIGRQTANIKPGVYRHGSCGETHPGMWRHDVASWTEMWEEAGRELRAHVRIEATLEMTKGFSKGAEGSKAREGEPDMSWRNDGDRRMVFEIWRV